MPFSKDPTHKNIIPRELFLLPHNRICSDQWGSRIFQILLISSFEFHLPKINNLQVLVVRVDNTIKNKQA